MSETRRRIEREITERPGVHFNELVRSLGLAPGQVQYHLRRLSRSGRVVPERLYGKTHYYTPEFTDAERGAIAVLRRETARDIVVYLLEAGPSRPQRVADALAIARSTLEWHLSRLMEQGLVSKRRPEGHQVVVVIEEEERAVELLVRIRPSLADRLVDRYTRLVDDLLAEIDR